MSRKIQRFLSFEKHNDAVTINKVYSIHLGAWPTSNVHHLKCTVKSLVKTCGIPNGYWFNIENRLYSVNRNAKEICLFDKEKRKEKLSLKEYLIFDQSITECISNLSEFFGKCKSSDCKISPRWPGYPLVSSEFFKPDVCSSSLKSLQRPVANETSFLTAQNFQKKQNWTTIMLNGKLLTFRIEPFISVPLVLQMAVAAAACESYL